MAIFSNMQKSFKTKAGVIHDYQEQLGITSSGEFYFVIPDDTDFRHAIDVMGLRTGRPPRSKKNVVFASTHEELTKVISSIVAKISEVTMKKNTFIFYKNDGDYSFYRNNHTGDIGPNFFPEADCERFSTNNHFSYKTGYSISLLAVVLTEKEYQDTEGNKKSHHEFAPSTELGVFGETLNEYAKLCDLDNAIMNGWLDNYEKLPYTEENAAFFVRFFDVICRFNYEILQKLEPEKLQSIITSNLLLLEE